MHRAWLVDDVMELIIECRFEELVDWEDDTTVFERDKTEQWLPFLCTSKRLFQLASKQFWKQITLRRLHHLVQVSTEDLNRAGFVSRCTCVPYGN